ncbi:hypothetical protein F4678DRAFT_122721 [Xylaria arbuscula]|nr:hypothetical protein F4678DRAFT_122721 [Xylaria arbuscula]
MMMMKPATLNFTCQILLGTTTTPPPSLPLAGSRTFVAETFGIRLFGGDVLLLALSVLGEVIAVAAFDLIARVPGTAVFAVPLQEHIRAHLSPRWCLHVEAAADASRSPAKKGN